MNLVLTQIVIYYLNLRSLRESSISALVGHEPQATDAIIYPLVGNSTIGWMGPCLRRDD